MGVDLSVTCYILAGLILLFACAYVWYRRKGGRQEQVDDAQHDGTRPSTSPDLDFTARRGGCPRCGSEQWPGAVRCWNCGYETRADDSESSS